MSSREGACVGGVFRTLIGITPYAIALFLGHLLNTSLTILIAVFGGLFGFFADIPRAMAWLFYGEGTDPTTRVRTGGQIVMDMLARVQGYKVRLEPLEMPLATNAIPLASSRV